MPNDPPLDFFDMSWLAVKAGEPDMIAQVLELSGPVAVSWMQGIHAVTGDFWDFNEELGCENSRVFVSPLVEGWRLVVGGWCGGTGDKDFHSVAECCRLLSERYGAAHAFSTQGRLGWYAWTLAQSGEVLRLSQHDSAHLRSGGLNLVIDEGTPPEIELQLRQAALDGGDRWWPGEDTVMAIARAFSIAPTDLGPHMQSVGQGFLFTTGWGRARGIPKRPLCNCVGKEASCGI